MKRLITNIGNRNITSLFNTENFKSNQFNFRGLSKELLQLFKKEPNHEKVITTKLNIIDKVIAENWISKEDEIILIGSDQGNNNTRSNQDTLHAAEIVKLLLIRDYHFNPKQIKVEKCKVSPVNQEEQLKYYRQLFNQLTECDLTIILNSGGTPQSKSALKIMAEHMIPDGKLKSIQVNDSAKNEGNDVIELASYEYKQIIQKENNRLLIRNAEFSGAFINSYIKGAVKTDDKLLNEMDKIFNNTEGHNLVWKKPEIKKYPAIQELENYKPFLHRDLPNYLLDKDYLKVRDLTFATHYCLNQGLWNKLVIKYSQLIELLTKSINIKFAYQNLNDLVEQLNKSEHDPKKWINQDNLDNYHDYAKVFNIWSKNITFSLPLEDSKNGISLPKNILITEHIIQESNSLDRLIELLKMSNSLLVKLAEQPVSPSIKFLDKMRNDMAHEGTSVKEEEIEPWKESIREICSIICPNIQENNLLFKLAEYYHN